MLFVALPIGVLEHFFGYTGVVISILTLLVLCYFSEKLVTKVKNVASTLTISLEASGMKNILKGYFSYIEQSNLKYDIPQHEMNTFCNWFFSMRLGSSSKFSKAISAMQEHLDSTGMPSPTLSSVLIGLLKSEGVLRFPLDFNSIEKVLNKFPPIPEEILGLDSLKKSETFYRIKTKPAAIVRRSAEVKKKLPPIDGKAAKRLPPIKKSLPVTCPNCLHEFTPIREEGIQTLRCPALNCGASIEISST